MSNMTTHSFEIIAHRGASEEEAENTMPAFIRAIEREADGIELDVRLTRDLVPVVIHDEQLMRLTGRRGRVGHLDYRHLADYRISHGGGTYAIPPLDDVLDLLAQQCPHLVIELKAQPGMHRELAYRVGAAVNPAAAVRIFKFGSN